MRKDGKQLDTPGCTALHPDKEETQNRPRLLVENMWSPRYRDPPQGPWSSAPVPPHQQPCVRPDGGEAASTRTQGRRPGSWGRWGPWGRGRVAPAPYHEGAQAWGLRGAAAARAPGLCCAAGAAEGPPLPGPLRRAERLWGGAAGSAGEGTRERWPSWHGATADCPALPFSDLPCQKVGHVGEAWARPRVSARRTTVVQTPSGGPCSFVCPTAPVCGLRGRL